MIVIGITLPDLVYGITATVVGFGLFIGATVNALYPRVKHYAIESSALATELSGKKIALVSDLHIGMVRKKAFVERVSKLIMSEQPDMILIAGDLIDGPRFPYDKFLAPLAQLAAPLGVYFTPGNHEHYNNQNDLFYQAVPSNVTVLIDQKIQLTDHAVDIIGIDYRAETFTETKSHLVAAGHEPERPTIVLLHDPKNTPALAESGVSLSVSGHTHGGQFFPGTLLIKFLYGKYAQGLALTNGMPSVTTVGAGGAVAPVRLGTRPEVAILTIVDTLQ